MPQALRGNILLYLPWEFDMLGGVDVVVERLWTGLEKRFPGAATIGIQDWASHGGRTDNQGRRFLRLNFPAPPSVEGKLPLRYLVTLARRLPAALRDLRKRSIATVNVHFPTLNAYPLALLKCSGLWRGRIVLSFHGSDVGAIIPDSPRWRTIAEQTDAVTACSAALARCIDELGLFHQAAQVVHNGIDCERFLREIDAAALPVSCPYILNVGNYVPLKAQDVLLQAFAQFAPQYPELNVVCAGGKDNGRWLNYLNELTDRLNLRNRVVFLENQPHSHIVSLMKQAVCLVHTSHREGFPLVLIEAATCGTPIIATRVGGIPEIIPSSDFGLLIDDGDINGLVKAMATIIQEPKEAESRGALLKERVATLFSADAMVNGYLMVICN